MLNKSNQKNLAGFTLLEVIVALFIVTVGITGVMSLIYQTIVFSSVASNRLMAAYLGQEGIEIVRNIRDTNWLTPGASWTDGLTGCESGCKGDYTSTSLTSVNPDEKLKIDQGFYKYSATGSETPFSRKITVSSLAPDILEVLVEINWQERGESYSFPVKEHLYKWY